MFDTFRISRTMAQFVPTIYIINKTRFCAKSLRNWYTIRSFQLINFHFFNINYFCEFCKTISAHIKYLFGIPGVVCRQSPYIFRSLVGKIEMSEKFNTFRERNYDDSASFAILNRSLLKERFLLKLSRHPIFVKKIPGDIFEAPIFENSLVYKMIFAQSYSNVQ